MPARRWLARLINRVGLNRITRHVTAGARGFGVIVHRGRKTGRVYRTPVNIFARRGGYTVALTYGTDSEWLRNALSAGSCWVVTSGRRVELIRPRVVHDPARRPGFHRQRPLRHPVGWPASPLREVQPGLCRGAP